MGRLISETIPDVVSSGDGLQLGDSRLPGQDRGKFDSTSAFAGGKLGFARGPNSVSTDSEPDHAEVGLRIEQGPCCRCGVRVARPVAAVIQNIQRPPKTPKLELSERRVERVFDVREVGVNAFDVQAGQFLDFPDKTGQLFDSDSLTIGSRFDFEMNVRHATGLLRGLRKSACEVQPVYNLAVTVSDNGSGMLHLRKTENRDRLLDTRRREHRGFIDGVDAKPVRGVSRHRTKLMEPVAVCVCFHDDHHGRCRRGDLSKSGDILPEPSCVQFNPRQHGCDYFIRAECYTQTVNLSADVIIIGGGVVGSSIALNLKRDGFSGRVVVVERDPSYQFASSTLAMGGVREQYMSRVNVEMAQYSIALFEKTPEVDFRQRGYLFLANAETWEKQQHRYQVEKSLGVDVELLGVSDIRKLVPELRCDDVVGAVFGRKDGYLDPRKVLRFLKDNAEKAGADFIADEVKRIDISRGAIKSAHLSNSGRMETDRIVIASGAYSGALGEIAGVRLPVTPVRQQLFRCELPRPWTYEFPMTIDPGGVHWRSYGENEIKIAKTRPDEPPGIRFGGDIDRFHSEILPDLVRRVPEFEGLKLIFGWGGLYEMTPDQNGIIDQHPAISGLYFACGFSGHGLMTSPATGKVMSELIRTGRFETIDASPFSYARFERNELFFDEATI
jgi:FAD-dependent oxidoreductase domain-containing protein 1